MQGDNEYSDSEDEGEGGRRNQESHKQRKKLKTDHSNGTATPAAAGDAPQAKKEDTPSDAPAEPAPSESLRAKYVTNACKWAVMKCVFVFAEEASAPVAEEEKPSVAPAAAAAAAASEASDAPKEEKPEVGDVSK